MERLVKRTDVRRGAVGETETREEMLGDVGMPGARPSHEFFIPSLPPAELQSWR
jgi:hypothetical protein